VLYLGGSIGFQDVHISDKEQSDWIRERVEVSKPWNHTVDKKLMILVWSESFEKFIPQRKAFRSPGLRISYPWYESSHRQLIDHSIDYRVKHITIRIAHHGHLNVLANVIRKPIEAILIEFSSDEADDWPAGDVNYHLSANYVRPTPLGKKVSLSLAASPSHVEAEDPVVLGKTRAIQHFENDETTLNVAMGVLLHGDAAFAGQGIVYETMSHNLPSYGTGGTIHLIVNNLRSALPVTPSFLLLRPTHPTPSMHPSSTSTSKPSILYVDSPPITNTRCCHQHCLLPLLRTQRD
jgi:2-oxoglutarate dehydrogenase E1 component